MEFLIFVIAFSIVVFILRVQTSKKNANKKIENVIIYTAEFLKNNPQEISINFDDIKYDELLKYVKRNFSRISNFEQLHSSSICFVIPIGKIKYKVLGIKYLFGQLVISCKKV